MKTFEDVQKFFKSWGLYPDLESTDDYNREVIRQGINRACFYKMNLEAMLYGTQFYDWVSNVIGAQDDSYFLNMNLWVELEVSWNSWKAKQSQPDRIFAIVYGAYDNSILCKTNEEVEEAIDKMIKQEHEVLVLRPHQIFRDGKEVE